MNERIKSLRKNLDLTQQEFADRIGVKRNTVATYEGGRNEPVDAVISLICREFNVNEEWLRTGSGEMFNPAPTDILDALAKEYNLSHNQYVFIEKFVNMKQETFNELLGFFSDVLRGCMDPDVPSFGASMGKDLFADIPETPEELERRFPPVDPSQKKKTG